MNSKKFLNHIFLLIIIFYVIIIPSFLTKIIKGVISVNEINLKIKGIGEKNIISDNQEIPTPDQLFLFDTPINGAKKVTLTSQISIIKIIWNSPFSKCNSMFENLEDIIEIDLSNFDSSILDNTEFMFYNCISLISLNLSNFDTSKALYIDHMFNECNSLIYLDISNFNTSSSVLIHNIFRNCYNLKSLDITHFQTSQIDDMNGMFENCYSLEYLELGNLNTSLVINMSNMFYNCTSLKSLNLYSFNTNKVISFSQIFFKVNLSNYCINDEINDGIKKLLTNFTRMNCSQVCHYNSQKKYILNKNKCINNCNNDKDYIYEYINSCYKSCPNLTHIIENNICENDLICNNYYNYEYKGCLDSIPLGYYLNDTRKKTIDKCNIKCNNCTIDSVLNDLCITCNTSAGYYPKFNDSLNNITFINCYNGELIGYYLDNDFYYQCHDNCKNCLEKGNIDHNKCTECYSNYTLIDGNCYPYLDIETCIMEIYMINLQFIIIQQLHV